MLCSFCSRAVSLKGARVEGVITRTAAAPRVVGWRSLNEASSSRKRKKEEEGDSSATRNVGILAHIDAGKTTTTERMLYYAGLTRKMGDVDKGSTVTDYLRQERERGITINSAAVTFHWRGRRINLIDTPGHVDFTFEVERSLCVVDGAVALFDASAGVEAQSITVWRQANRYNIPRIAFVNKLDKPAASLSHTVQSMEVRLRATPLVTQLPLGEGREFCGVIDLITMEALTWERGTDGATFSRVPLLKGAASEATLKEAMQARYHLAEQVVSLDDQLVETVLEDSFDPLNVDAAQLQAGLRRLTLSCAVTPVLCGSALRNTGIQPLLDAITAYLPSPRDRTINIPTASLQGLCAYAFKVTHDVQRGPLVYLRVYSGSLRAHSSVYNFTKRCFERVSRVLLMLGEEQREVAAMGEGNIAVAVGMKNTYTGDTLVDLVGKTALERGKESADMLTRLEAPPPVFFCTVEPDSAAQQQALDHALSCLVREDPSLHVSTDQDTGQMVLSGMGELHLEIIHERLRSDYAINCSLGRLRVAYHETPTTVTTHTATLDSSLGGQRHTAEVSVQVTPSPSNSRPTISVARDIAMATNGAQKEMLEALTNGVEKACVQGPLLGCPVWNVRVDILSVRLGTGTSLAMLSTCVAQATSKALAKADPQLLEPFTELVVTLPVEYLGVVLGDLSASRRAQVKEVGEEEEEEGRVISALAPLACLTGYSTILRTLTSGTGTFTFSFSHYEPLSQDLQNNVIKQSQGYL